MYVDLEWWLTVFQAPWYYASGSPNAWDHDIFTERDPKIHADVRRKLATLYSMTSLLRVENYASECSEILVAKFNKIAESGSVIDLQQWMQFFAFDVIAMITVGLPFLACSRRQLTGCAIDRRTIRLHGERERPERSDRRTTRLSHLLRQCRHIRRSALVPLEAYEFSAG